MSVTYDVLPQIFLYTKHFIVTSIIVTSVTSMTIIFIDYQIDFYRIKVTF